MSAARFDAALQARQSAAQVVAAQVSIRMRYDRWTAGTGYLRALILVFDRAEADLEDAAREHPEVRESIEAVDRAVRAAKLEAANGKA